MCTFNTPEWESNTIADKNCQELFEINNKLPNKIKGKSKRKNIAFTTAEYQKQADSKELSVQNEFIKKTHEKSFQNRNQDVSSRVEKKKKKRLEKKQKRLNDQLKYQNESLPEVSKINNATPKKILENKSFKDHNNKHISLSDNDSLKRMEKKKMKRLEKKQKKLEVNNVENDYKRNETLPSMNTLKNNMTSKSEIVSLKKEEHFKKKGRDLTLREKMMQKLRASRFRYINEQIYTKESKETQKFFTYDPDSFTAYHEGYRQQVANWPINPLDVIINSIKKMSPNLVIADFGCGRGDLAKSIKQKVHSFDLVALNKNIVACDMANVPLKNKEVDVVVFCLSLMGTNLRDYILEANRVLKIGGVLKIAEVESRFDTVDTFIQGLHCFGFKNVWKDLSHNLFYFLDFKKVNDCKMKKKLPTIGLLPCLYKKR